MAYEGSTGWRRPGPRTSFALRLVTGRGDTTAQEAVEEHWAEMVRAARLKYQIAESELRRVVAGQRKWPVAEADGTALLLTARLQELAARNEYVRLLKTFTELLLRGD